MSETLTYSGALVVHACWCGIRHSIPKELDRHARNGGTVYCPLGHQWVMAKTDADKLRAELDQAQADARWHREQATRARVAADHQAAVARGYKGALVKAKKKAAKGMCPVPGCRRHFVNVQRHVENQHPDFDGTAEA